MIYIFFGVMSASGGQRGKMAWKCKFNSAGQEQLSSQTGERDLDSKSFFHTH